MILNLMLKYLMTKTHVNKIMMRKMFAHYKNLSKIVQINLLASQIFKRASKGYFQLLLLMLKQQHIINLTKWISLEWKCYCIKVNLAMLYKCQLFLLMKISKLKRTPIHLSHKLKLTQRQQKFMVSQINILEIIKTYMIFSKKKMLSKLMIISRGRIRFMPIIGSLIIVILLDYSKLLT